MLEYANGDRKIVLLNDHHPFEVSTGVGLTTITDYFVRGDYGKASYRGNCTGLLVKDLLTYFKPPFRSDFIWLHPPYYVPNGSPMPKYSGSQWGTLAHPSDGSHLEDWDAFMKWFNQFVARGYENLANGGRLAVLIGDTRFKGKLYSPFKEMNVYADCSPRLKAGGSYYTIRT